MQEQEQEQTQARRGFSIAERADLWARWKAGESMSDIGRASSCSSGSGGWEYLGTVYGTSYLDAELHASAYDGSSCPSALTYGYIAYEMYAINPTDVSSMSSFTCFTLSQ